MYRRVWCMCVTYFVVGAFFDAGAILIYVVSFGNMFMALCFWLSRV